jgi:hypothetical protein
MRLIIVMLLPLFLTSCINWKTSKTLVPNVKLIVSDKLLKIDKRPKIPKPSATNKEKAEYIIDIRSYSIQTGWKHKALVEIVKNFIKETDERNR